jgi:hypothetical protein
MGVSRNTNMSKEIQNKLGSDRIEEKYKNPDIFIGDIQKLTEYQNLKDLKELSPAQVDRKKKLIEELAILYGLENGIWAANLAREKYYSSLARMRSDVVKDFNCRTSLELMLADRIVAHYWRAMKNDTIINFLTEDENSKYSFNQQKINILNELHRGVEFADRQLVAKIILLKELKQPQLNIKVTTKNAFVSQNQQINVDKKNNEDK